MPNSSVFINSIQFLVSSIRKMSILVDPVVSMVVEGLGQWLIGEAKSIQGVRLQVEEIQRELRYMKCFLVDAAYDEQGGGGGRGKTVHNWVLEVQDIAYDAEDAIETFVLKVASRRGRGGGIQAFVQRYSCIFKEWMLRRSIGFEIQEIKSRIGELRQRLPTYGVKALTENQAFLSTRSRQSRALRQTYPHDEETDFVGLHEDVEKLVGVLAKEDSKWHTVCICGMGGSGMTTLAKKIYNHRDVKRGFECFAWVCISQQFNAKDVLQAILNDLSPGRGEEISKLMERQVVKQLYEFLESKKCLVVIDDIWETVDWDCLKPAFPIGGRGMRRSKIIFMLNPIYI